MHSRGNPGRQNIHYGDINRRNDEKTPLILPNCKLQRPLALDDLAQKAVNAQPQRTARKNGAGPGQAGGTGAQQAHGFYDAGLLLGHLLDHGSAGLLGVFQLVDALLQLDDVLQGQLTSTPADEAGLGAGAASFGAGDFFSSPLAVLMTLGAASMTSPQGTIFSAVIQGMAMAYSTSLAKSARRERSPRANWMWPPCCQPLKRSTT